MTDYYHYVDYYELLFYTELFVTIYLQFVIFCGIILCPLCFIRYIVMVVIAE